MFSMMNLPRTLMGWRMASDPRITTETRRMRSRNSPSGQYQHTTRVDQYRQRFRADGQATIRREKYDRMPTIPSRVRMMATKGHPV